MSERKPWVFMDRVSRPINNTPTEAEVDAYIEAFNRREWARHVLWGKMRDIEQQTPVTVTPAGKGEE